MHPNEQLINTFYTAFGKRGYQTMNSCYHPEATFTDPVFTSLKGKQVLAMWHMLCSSSTDLAVDYKNVKADASKGECYWDAFYSFSATKRRVHNKVSANFTFKDGLIISQKDSFDFYAWLRMALGTPGVFLGWTPFLKNKIRARAAANLEAFIQKHPEYQ